MTRGIVLCLTITAGLTLILTQPAAATGPQFTRGDCNYDGTLNIADPVALLDYLYGPGTPLPLDCETACDANDDGNLDIADVVTKLTVLFQPGAAPLPPPFEHCGGDFTPDTLFCGSDSPACPSPSSIYLWSLASGNQTGLTEQVTIVRDEPTWQALWQQHDASQATPAIDFSYMMVVVVVRYFSEPAGYVFLDVYEFLGDIQVHLSTHGCPGAPAGFPYFEMVVAEAYPGPLDLTEFVYCP